MSRDQQRLRDYPQHILDAIKRIQRYITDVDEVSYLESELIQDAVIRNLEIIGEDSRNINRHFPKYAEHHSNVPKINLFCPEKAAEFSISVDHRISLY